MKEGREGGRVEGEGGERRRRGVQGRDGRRECGY